MTPLERAVAAIENMTGWDADGEPHIDIVRAVIGAVREPSDAMAEAADDLGPDKTGAQYWPAMIDALLEEGR